MNTGLLLEQPILRVSISMVPPSSFTGSFESLALPEVPRRIGHVLPPTRLVRLVDDGRVVSVGRRPEALRRVQVNAGLGRHAVPTKTGSCPVRRFLGHEARADARHLLRSCTTHVVEDALAVVAGREGFLGHRRRMLGYGD